MKRIKELFPNVEVEEDFKVMSIQCDSRYVGKNSIFFCIDGLIVDGHKYIDDAIFQGAKCIVYSKPLTYKTPEVLFIKVDNVLDELNRVADLFYDFSSKKMTMMGVAGTTGKTVVSNVIKSVLSHYLKMGYIGTNTIEYDGVMTNTRYTTPDSIELQRALNAMVKRDVKGVAMELSSVGLALKRADSVHFNYAIFTNTLEEQLDFHGTYENIMKSNARLLQLLDDNGVAIFNADDVKFMHYIGQTNRYASISYGIKHKADIMARNVEYFIDHTRFDILYEDKMYSVESPLIGYENTSYVLAAIATLISLGLSLEDIIANIKDMKQIPGRFELLDIQQPYHAIVDLCPYKSSYQSIFSFLNETVEGRIVVVGSLPSKKEFVKRKLLGTIINDYADYAILTQLDEYDDGIESMCEEIQGYITDIPSLIVTDRKVAVEQAVMNLSADDCLIVLGKGNEQFMSSSSGFVPYVGDAYIIRQAIKHLHD